LSEAVDIDKAMREEVEDSTSDSDIEVMAETEDVPPHILKRRYGVSAEALGAFNSKHGDWNPPTVTKPPKQCELIVNWLKECPLFCALEDTILGRIADSMEIEKFKAGQNILQQGGTGRSGYLIMEGSVDVCDDDPEEGWEGTNSPRDSTGAAPSKRGQLVHTLSAGRFFGEMTMLWGVRRTKSVYASKACKLAKLKRDTYNFLVTRGQMLARTQREEILRRVAVFETLSQEHVAQIADALIKRTFEQGERIVKQGEEGKEFYVVLTGECVVTVATGSNSETADVQEYERYLPGDLFGERALLNKTQRAATVTATTRVEVLCLKRSKFERMLGPLQNLQHRNYLSDPRKRIADFYETGNSTGPRGVCKVQLSPRSTVASHWFAVYRPTSRDAIARMLTGKAVGKGLNVKGKSAKKNHLAGFVPFLQISKSEHKDEIEETEASARLTVYYTSEMARDMAQAAMEMQIPQMCAEDLGAITHVDRYPGVFGLNVPLSLVRKCYIMDQDISQRAGWETGRQSEPAFMDMNMHATCGDSLPEVVLYQMDTANPMNPHGLLVAYAEASVKPVVSDFDTFTIGSRGMRYEKLPVDQQDLAMWSLERTEEILKTPSSASWNSRWLAVLKEANSKGFHPECPKYGWGDATSQRLTQAAVEATIECGAIRHGSECFNYYFPQELDEDYLVVWDGFDDKPWAYMAERDLRDFLLDRIDDDYTFPLNPVWPIRDPGWNEIYEALLFNEETAEAYESWFPPESGIRERIEAIHEQYARGFYQTSQIVEVTGPRISEVEDVDSKEISDLVLDKVRVHRLSAGGEGDKRLELLEWRRDSKRAPKNLTLRRMATRRF